MDNETFRNYKLHIIDRDKEHKDILDSIRLADNAITDGRASDAMMYIDLIVEHARHHFHHEEEYMKDIDYPYLQYHRISHIDLKTKIYMLNNYFPNVETIAQTNKVVARFYLSEVKVAIINHIDHADRQYAEFVLNK